MSLGLFIRNDKVLTFLLVLSIVVLLSTMAWFIEKVTEQAMIKEQKEQLITVAVFASKMVRAEDLEKIRVPEDRNREEFIRILNSFRKIMEDVPSVVALYTMRPARDGGFEFIVDSQPDDEDLNKDGEITDNEKGALPGLIYTPPEGANMLLGLKQPTTDETFTKDPWGVTLSGYAPIYDNFGNPVALVGVDIDQKRFLNKMETIRLSIYCITTFIGILLATISFLLVRQMRLYRRAQALQRHLLAMNVELTKFVPRIVRDVIEKTPDSCSLEKKEQDVTIAFFDLSGYSRLTELLEPNQLNMIVEKYLSEYLMVVEKLDGEVAETAGDGFMVIFMDKEGVKHAEKAAIAALEVMAVNERLNLDAKEKMSVHIGIASGVALVGATTLHGRKVDRATYTATGMVTNLAARIAQIAQPGEILVSKETANRIEGRFILESIGFKKFKNISEHQEVFLLRKEKEI